MLPKGSCAGIGGLHCTEEDKLAEVCVMPVMGSVYSLISGASPQQQVRRGCVLSKDFGWEVVKMATQMLMFIKCL